MGDAEATHIAELSFHDAAADYAKGHGISYDKAMKKLGGIYEGTTYEATWDAHGVPHVKIDDDHIKFVKSAVYGHHPAGGHGVHHPLSTNADVLKPSGVVVPSMDATDAVNNSQWNAEVLENQQAEVNAASEQYGKVLNASPDSGVLHNDYVDEKALRIALDGAKKNVAEIASNPDGSYGRTLRNVLKAFSDKNITEWNRIEKLEAVKLLAPEGSPELGSLSQEARAAMKAYGDLVPPKKGELMGKWVVRFMQAAKDGLIKK
jgi:hypothetical protein